MTPNRSQAMSMTAKGRRQSPVNAVETSAGGRFSGSLNKCRISGLGLLGASLTLSFPLSTATTEIKILKMIEGDKKGLNMYLETGDQCPQCANSQDCSQPHRQ